MPISPGAQVGLSQVSAGPHGSWLAFTGRLDRLDRLSPYLCKLSFWKTYRESLHKLPFNPSNLSKSSPVQQGLGQLDPRVEPICAALALANVTLGKLLCESALTHGLQPVLFAPNQVFHEQS